MVNILFVMRTAGYFPYHQTTIDHLLARGHRVTLLFDHDSGPIDERGFQEWLARGPQVTVGPALQRRGGVWRRVLFAVREARSYASYCRRGPEATFYRERWRQYLPQWLRRSAEHNRLVRTAFRAPLDASDSSGRSSALPQRAATSWPRCVETDRTVSSYPPAICGSTRKWSTSRQRRRWGFPPLSPS